MKKMVEFHESVDFQNLIYYFKGKNTDTNSNNFVDTKTIYNKLKSHKIKLDDK